MRHLRAAVSEADVLALFRYDLESTDRRKSEESPFRHTSEDELRELAARGADKATDAFFELVARDPRYLFSNAGRARLHLWYLQRQRVVSRRAVSDEGASARLGKLAKALTRGSRAKDVDARDLYRTFKESRSAVRAAIKKYQATRYTKPSEQTLVDKCNISLRTARRIRELNLKLSDKIELVVDVEAAKRLHLQVDRVAQLRRQLTRQLQEDMYTYLHDDAYLDEDDVE
jgi:hypothetical protein